MKRLVLSFSSLVYFITKKTKQKTKNQNKQHYHKIYQIFLGKGNRCETNWWFPLYFLLEIKSSCLIWCSCKILKIYVFLIKMDFIYEVTECWHILFPLCLKNWTHTSTLSEPFFVVPVCIVSSCTQILKPGLYWNFFLKCHFVYTFVIFNF